jgi:uncharacterized radical SAM protein YgiQ
MVQARKSPWLPTAKKEVEQLGWEQLDVILFTGDSYVDHPSFGIAVIGRVLENMGLKVAVVPQPNWQDDLRDFKKLGRPRLFFGVSSGNMDSMINHYTANKRLRSDDAYTAGDKSGFRPDYATTVYCKILKSIYPDVPVIIGGIEASLRRFTHYDYWSDTLRKPILVDTQADLLVYGMGERAIKEIANAFINGETVENMKLIPQTAYISAEAVTPVEGFDDITIAKYEECLADKTLFAKTFRTIEEESNKMRSKRLIEPVDAGFLVVNPPARLMSTEELDAVYALPFTRLPHPRYYKKGNIPAYEMIKFSVNIHRGCFGGCSFCTISAHQGKFITSRSTTSIMDELSKLSMMSDFKGNITDLGGPSANMYQMQGKDQELCNKCKRPSCTWPKICPNLNTDHSALNDLYKKVRELPYIKKATVGSGIRLDLLNNDNESSRIYKTNLIKHHVSGRLKVAPEHTNDNVLHMMRKPPMAIFKKFHQEFTKLNTENNLRQQLIPYFISSHPGCTIDDMRDLASEMKSMNIQLEQVQDFTPTPMTVSSVTYYTGIDPYTLKPVFVEKNKEKKLAQKETFFWKKR